MGIRRQYWKIPGTHTPPRIPRYPPSVSLHGLEHPDTMILTKSPVSLKNRKVSMAACHCRASRGVKISPRVKFLALQLLAFVSVCVPCSSTKDGYRMSTRSERTRLSRKKSADWVSVDSSSQDNGSSTPLPWKVKVQKAAYFADTDFRTGAKKSTATNAGVYDLKSRGFKIITDSGAKDACLFSNNASFTVEYITLFQDEEGKKGVFLRLKSKNRFMPAIDRYIWPVDDEHKSIQEFNVMLQCMLLRHRPKVGPNFYVCHPKGKPETFRGDRYNLLARFVPNPLTPITAKMITKERSVKGILKHPSKLANRERSSSLPTRVPRPRRTNSCSGLGPTPTGGLSTKFKRLRRIDNSKRANPVIG